MNWIMAHTDAVYFGIMCIIAGLSYFLGKDTGYVKGLEDGHKKGHKAGYQQRRSDEIS